MPYRNKTYVCFDGDTDMHYYRLMTAWKQHDGIDFNFYNAHELNTARDSSQAESIKKQLRLRLRNSRCFIILIGARTRYLTKFVAWEMEQAIELDLPIIAVNLNGNRKQDLSTCPPTIRQSLAVYVPFNVKILQYAMDNWPRRHAALNQDGLTGPRFYKDSVYETLGL